MPRVGGDASRIRRTRVTSAGAAATVAIAIFVAPLLIVNALRVLATERFTTWEVGRLEPDRYGLTQRQRETLALLGLESVRPGTEGIALLERATLPDGSPAFDDRELSHMRDVRRMLGGALRLQLAAAVAIILLALGFARTRLRAVVPRGLLLGALATVGIAILLVPVLLLWFDGFFTRFHELFFDGDSWRFSNTDTLIRVYPERFWVDVSQLAAALTVAQAVALGALAWWWLRAARRKIG